MSKSGSFFYCLGQGVKNIGRNKVFSLASIVTVAVCIFLIGVFLAVSLNIRHVIGEAEDAVCITVFFDEGLSEEEILDIGARIRDWPEVSQTSFTSADQAWINFRNDYFKDKPELAEGFADDNPLAGSASYDIYLNDIALQQTVAEKLEATEGVRQVNRSETTANALTDIGKVVGIVSLVLIVILVAISIFLIANTIVTGITVRREEIQIMKYVGATDIFVKSPFLLEGIIIGVIGAIIPLVVLFLIYNTAITYIMGQLQTLTRIFTFLPIWDIFKILTPAALLIGAGIGLIGSSIAAGRHIKV